MFLQYENFCENDLHLQTIVNLGFGQDTFDPQSFHGWVMKEARLFQII